VPILTDDAYFVRRFIVGRELGLNLNTFRRVNAHIDTRMRRRKGRRDTAAVECLF
jgi:hypothetical protein